MKDTLATAPILALDWKLPNLINKHLTPEQHRDIALRILIRFTKKLTHQPAAF
jgi:hypothetical protein